MKIKAVFFSFLLILILTISCLPSEASIFSRLTAVWAKGNREKVKYVFEANRETTYNLWLTADSINITFKYTIPRKTVKKPIVRSPLVKHISISNSDKHTFIKIPLKYPVKYKTKLNKNPWSLTLELEGMPDKIFKRNYSSGIEYLKIIRKVKRGYAEVNILKANPSSVEVFPAIATHNRKEPSLLESIIRFFTFSAAPEEPPFVKEKVSIIAKENGADFAINGTFFASSGRPLGILMIDGDLIASTIYERTAFAIRKDGKGYIDNFLENNYVILPDGVNIDITATNKVRRENEVILYTPRFGSRTDTDDSGIELKVIGKTIVGYQAGNSSIPENGFVISFSKHVKNIVKRSLSHGRVITVSLNLMPLSAKESIPPRHIIGGGPRLVKSGMVYVSKKEERFRHDVATSRAARTAVAIDKKRNFLFVAVDGKPRERTNLPTSIGMTLEELSELLIDYGVVDAMNLDGGSSSTMIVNGELKNKPVSGHEVRVSNAILIKPKSN